MRGEEECQVTGSGSGFATKPRHQAPASGPPGHTPGISPANDLVYPRCTGMAGPVHAYRSDRGKAAQGLSRGPCQVPDGGPIREARDHMACHYITDLGPSSHAPCCPGDLRHPFPIQRHPDPSLGRSSRVAGKRSPQGIQMGNGTSARRACQTRPWQQV